MIQPSDPSALQRRATWVGLKTLRQRPKIVDETKSGEPVFEVRSVRLLLREDANHFSRLTECSRCGRDVPGAPVLTPADLDRPANPVICRNCVRASVASSPLQPVKRPPPDEARTTASVPEAETPPTPPSEPVDDVRLAALEVQLEAALSRLAGLSPDDTEARLRAALKEGLAQVRADVAASAQGSAARLAALESQVRQNADALAGLVEEHRRNSAALAAALTETRAEVQRLGDAHRELEQRLIDVTSRIPERTIPAEEIDRRIDEGVARSRSDSAVALGQTVEMLRGDVEISLAEPVRRDLVAVGEALQQLSRGLEELQARIQLIDKAKPDADALGDVERRMEEAVVRLTAEVESHSRQLKVASSSPQASSSSWPLPDPSEPSSRGLLDGLERQLQEAEGRLARLTGAPGDQA